MEGKIATEPKKELALDTDWLSALLVACGLIVILVIIGFDVWHMVHGGYGSPRVHRERLFWRVLDSFFFAFTIFICVNLAIKVKERIPRFAFGLLSIELLVRLPMMWLRFSSSTADILTTASDITQLAGFVLLAVFGVQWFKSKVVHV